MSKVKQIIIVGHPGAGKAVLGRAIADRLHWDYIDADYGIELMTGALADQILSQAGNEGLRNCEYKILDENKHRENIVLNTDAGIVLSERNRELMKNAFYIVFVYVSLDVQLERLSMNNPPLLANCDIKSLLNVTHERDSFFREVANIEINTDDGSIDAHVMAVVHNATLYESVIKDGSIKIDELDLVHLHRITHKPVKLSEQQAVVLKLLAHGKSAKEIAQDLDISHRTVEGHLANIKEVLGCSSSMDLISLYLGRD
jgi:shikimate kinase